MITSETLPGVLLGLAIIAIGTFLGVRSTQRKASEAAERSHDDLGGP